MSADPRNSAERFDAKDFLRTLTSRPGVYRMVGHDGEVLYVGKAGNLRRRVSSYFGRSVTNAKTRAMVAQIRGVEVTVTNTEAEALILENNLIKAYRPRYNVLLRDDKSYPYIHLSTHQDYPRLGFHRGPRRARGRYFGPYPNAGSVRESLNLLQKLFGVRQCEDVFFRNRSRPCLQYQIKRCSGPCVGLIGTEGYARDVRLTELVLEGRNAQVIEELVERMERASRELQFEEAARLRDQIAALRRVQERQYVSGDAGDVDVIACAGSEGHFGIQLLFIRQGRVLGNRSFFPKVPDGAAEGEVLEGFLSQHYPGRSVPELILLSHPVAQRELLEKVLGEERGAPTRLSVPRRGERSRWVQLALTNAGQALRERLASRSAYRTRLENLQDALGLEQSAQRLECFDVSHTMGEATVASCVVFTDEGPLKSDYRRFNIKDVEPGDDYAALTQAVTRRYTRVKREEGKLPDVLFIDGGKGQLAAAAAALQELQIDGLSLVGVAKGEGRKPGSERLFLFPSKSATILPADSPALLLVQQIRDEAHRFAIAGHRGRRARARSSSPLEEVRGLGPKRRQMLLRQFGGLREVSRAGVEDLARVKGVSRELAQRIFDAFHVDDR